RSPVYRRRRREDTVRSTSAPLVGRDAWLRELLAALTAVGDGRSGCVVIEGPAGIGKSRLLTVVADAARARGLALAVARPIELDRIAPLSPLLRALRAAEPPVLGDTALADLGEQEGSRFWLLNRLGEMIEEFATSRPLVIVVDDAQWADE